MFLILYDVLSKTKSNLRRKLLPERVGKWIPQKDMPFRGQGKFC